MCLAGGCVAEAIVGTGRQSVRNSLKNVLGTKRGRGYRLLSKDGTSLTIQNMTFDGDKLPQSDSLITVEGNLTLGQGAILQNNSTYYRIGGLGCGGAIYAGRTSTLNLGAGSIIRNNEANRAGQEVCQGVHLGQPGDGCCKPRRRHWVRWRRVYW